MNTTRLTGIEFSWFSKCQLLASDYGKRWGMDLEPDFANLIQSVALDARTSFTGPQSMRRVAGRLASAADAIDTSLDDQDRSSDACRDSARSTAALRYLSSQLAKTAADVEAWKHSSPAHDAELVPAAPLPSVSG